jgi:hypothetical protein
MAKVDRAGEDRDQRAGDSARRMLIDIKCEQNGSKASTCSRADAEFICGCAIQFDYEYSNMLFGRLVDSNMRLISLVKYAWSQFLRDKVSSRNSPEIPVDQSVALVSLLLAIKF